MKAFFKRYVAATCALICGLALCGAWTGVRLSAGSGTFRLDDIEGDATYLDGICIEMTESDAVHAQRLTLDSGALSHSCSYTTPFDSSVRIRRSGSQAFVESPDADVQETSATTLASTGEDYELWITRITRKANEARISVNLELDKLGLSSHTDTQWVQVVTGITVSGEGYPFEFNLERETTVYTNQVSAQGEPLPDTTSEMPFDYTETQADPVSDMGYSAGPLVTEAADGTVYFTPSLMPYYGGTSAIYRVNEWNSEWGSVEASATVDGFPCFPDSNSMPMGSVSEVATFPAGGLRTVALDVVDDRLCLLLISDGMLTLRIYGMDGALQSETPLYGIDPEQELASTLYSNESGGSTMLCYYFRDALTDEYGNQKILDTGSATLCCVRLGDTAELISLLTDHDPVMRAAFIGGHWVLVQRESPADSGGNAMLPDRYYVSVLNADGATLYRGEVVTYISEDQIQFYIGDDTERDGELTLTRTLTVEAIMEE